MVQQTGGPTLRSRGMAQAGVEPIIECVHAASGHPVLMLELTAFQCVLPAGVVVALVHVHIAKQ